MSTVLRVIQEALANVDRHAEATRARVLLRVVDDGLELEISDDGKGIGTGALHSPGEGHFGLWIIRERARSLGGTAEVVTQPNGGTAVKLSLPLGRGAES
jgi:signal transduction histidine kinase